MCRRTLNRRVVAQPFFLAVEDDAVIRQAIGRSAHGLMGVRFAETGAQALAAVQGGDLPGFILLDYDLPDVNGIEVLRRLRADARLASVMVFMFSSLEDPVRARQALEQGAAAWIAKPDDPRAFHATIRALCSSCAAASRGAPSPPA